MLAHGEQQEVNEITAFRNSCQACDWEGPSPYLAWKMDNELFFCQHEHCSLGSQGILDADTRHGAVWCAERASFTSFGKKISSYCDIKYKVVSQVSCFVP